MKTNSLLLIVVLTFIFTQQINAQVNVQDSLALVDLYNSTDGPNWGGGNWCSGVNVPGWNGITVEDGRVTKIDLMGDIYSQWPKINGSLPESIGNLSALTEFRIWRLSGTIPESICNLKSLTKLVLYGKFTGGIPENIGNLNKLNQLVLSYNLSGIIPESIGNLTALTYLKISNNTLSGGIPESIGNLTSLQHLDLSKNDLHGEIPESLGNLTLLTILYIRHNNFSGQLPDHFENIDLLERLDLEGAFTGKIPSTIGDMASLKRLEIFAAKYNTTSRKYEYYLTGGIPKSFGNLSNLEMLNITGLSGEIPESIGNLKKLNMFSLANCNLSGEIPESIGNLKNLTELSIFGCNLSGKIPKSIGNLTALTRFYMSKNNLTGGIPESIGNMTALTDFSVGSNNLSGEIPSTIKNLTNLTDLRLNNNHFSTITKIPPNLNTLYIDNNNLDFNDLEPLAKKEIRGFRFVKQDTLTLEKTIDNKETTLTMHAGGTVTTYQWFYDNVEVEDATDSTYIIPAGKEIQKYHCKAKNIYLRNLTLIGKYKEKEQKDCWQAGQLTFCVHSGKWEKAGSNKIKTTNTISVNDFLYFDGTMTIDTADLEIDADGEFYVRDIPLPGGSIGKYSLSRGKYNLKLMGKDGEITNFLNSKLEASPELFGVELKLDNLQLVKDSSEFGLKIECTMKVPGITGGCEEENSAQKKDVEIKLNGLKITTAGISLGGVNIKDLGLGAEDYCLKQLSLNYDSKKDILTSGMQLALPFGEVGGGFKLEEGLIDSIAWHIEASSAVFVLGSTTIGIKGFFGHISNITKPAIEVELGGIFSDVTSDKLYRIEASGKTVWPTYFEIKGKGEFLKPIDRFQIQGGVALSYNIPNKLFGIAFNGKAGNIDGENWILNGNGNFKVGFNRKPITISGKLNGTASLKELPDYFPYKPFKYIINFPIELQSRNTLIIGKQFKIISGVATFKYRKFDPFSFIYTVDLSKPSNDEDFLVFQKNKGETKSAIISEKSGHLDKITKTFVIPENTELAEIEINSPGTAPASTLTDNTGKKYTSSSENDNVLKINSNDSKQSFWLISSPKTGTWSVSIENPGETDTIITYFQLKQTDFKFAVNQTGNTVTVNWDIAQVKDGQTVNILLDDNNFDFDGLPVASGDAKSGQLSFNLDETTPDCSYYLFAQLIGDCSVVEAYADKVIDNPFSSLAPPLNFTSYYNSETGECEFNWDTNQEDDITGYILTITDDQDNDSVYAIINGNQNYISLFIEDFETKSAEIKAYNQDWKIGCPSVLTELTTGIEEDYQIIEELNNLKVYPNPTNGDLTIRYYVPEPSECEIRIFNIQGKEIARPLSGFQPAGFHQLNFQYKNIPNGMYLIKYVNNNRSTTVKSVFSK